MHPVHALRFSQLSSVQDLSWLHVHSTEVAL